MEINRINIPKVPNVRVGKKMPKPFARPSITIGASIPSSERREWTEVPAGDIRVGDIVPGLGRIFSVSTTVDAPRHGSSLSPAEIADRVVWSVTLAGGVNNTRTYHGSDTIWAFTAKAAKE